MAMAAIIRIIATTIKSSINEKPFCLRMIHLILFMCTPAPIGGPHGWRIRHMWWRPLGFSTLGACWSAFHECLLKSEGTANDEECHKRRHKMSRDDPFESFPDISTVAPLGRAAVPHRRGGVNKGSN